MKYGIFIIIYKKGLTLNIISKINIKILYVIFTLFILSMLIFPVFSLANYAEPLIFGMPFIMVWVLFWIIIEFLGLIVFVKIDKDIED